MKAESIKFKHKASTREYLIALANYPNFTKLLNPENKVYKPLFDWLIENEVFLSNEDNPLPTAKELAKELNINSSKIAKYIKMIYDDIFDLNDKQPHLFKKDGQILCFLSFKYIDDVAWFNLGFDFIPRKGEALHFYFVKPQNGGHSFHVTDVVHSFDMGQQEIRIYLDSEYPLTYMDLLKEKAYLHGDISFSELLCSTNFDLKEKLVKLHKTL